MAFILKFIINRKINSDIFNPMRGIICQGNIHPETIFNTRFQRRNQLGSKIFILKYSKTIYYWYKTNIAISMKSFLISPKISWHTDSSSITLIKIIRGTISWSEPTYGSLKLSVIQFITLRALTVFLKTSVVHKILSLYNGY